MRFVAAIACLVLLTGAMTLHAASAELVNGIAVIVNDEVITYQEVKDLIGPDVAILEERLRNKPAELQQKILELQEDAIEQLVDAELILHDFATGRYNLPEAVIEDEINRRIKTQFGDRVRMTKSLQARGMTFEGYKRQVREQIIVSQLRNFHVSSGVFVSPFKVEKYYDEHKEDFKVEDQVKLRMIVINQPPGAPEDRARNRAAEILIKLDQGDSFAELAKVNSEGSNAKSGGDWGWVERNVLREDLSKVAFSLDKGQHSGVISTPDACFILLVEDKKTSSVKSLAEVGQEIENLLLGQERARLQKKYIDRLKAKQFVRYF